MSDLNVSNSPKNNLSEGQYVKLSDPLHLSEVDRNVLSKNSNIKCAAAGPSSGKKYNVSPGTEVYASSTCEDEIFFDFDRHTVDELVSDQDVRFPIFDNKSSKYSVPNEMDEAFSNYKTNLSKSPIVSDLNVKYNVDKQSKSATSKNKNSTNFSIFGQLLNKRQSNVSAPKSCGSPSNYSLPQNSSLVTSHLPKNESPEPTDGAQRAQMKTKLKSMWNNVKYGWRIKREVNLKTDSAIWLLGRCYHNKLNDDLDLTQDVAEQLRLDLLSKIWLTYRINFPAIPGTNLVTDSGWGCMLRCGQMMMAQAFVCHFLERDWRISSQQTEDKSQQYKTILRWFGDSLSENSPFSLHHLVSMGENYGRKAGDWYGPTHAAHVLRDALREAKKHHPQLQELCMYVASDGIVFKQDVMDLCYDSNSGEKSNSNTSLSSDFATISLTEVQNNSSSEIIKDNDTSDFVKMGSKVCEDAADDLLKSYENTCPSYTEFGPPSYSIVDRKWKSLILFVSVRLGNDKINPFYIPCLKSLLAYEHCIGIIGGRPKHALYFIGWQDDKIIHMDPHSCQPAIDVEKEDFNEKSFHSSSVRTMSFSEMDPSCSIGFYFRKLEDFQFFIEKFSEITAPLKRNLEYPVFALTEGKRTDVVDDSLHPNEKCIYPPLRSSSCIADDDDVNDDDYILL